MHLDRSSDGLLRHDESGHGLMPHGCFADTVLSGYFTISERSNYDSLHSEGNGQLYLLYVRNYLPQRALLALEQSSQDPPSRSL